MFRFLRGRKPAAPLPVSEVPALLEETPPVAPLSSSSVLVEDTFAEAFPMSATALIVTADSMKWAMEAATIATGFATSVIGCGAEAGVDRQLGPSETPDGRPGARILIFSFSPAELQKQVDNRAGQCILTCPGTACFAGMEPTATKIDLGANMRYFGDGFQSSKVIGGRRFWRIPVMDGEFLCEDVTYATTEAVGGGNLILLGATRDIVLRAAETAAGVIRQVPGVIVPFPGGIARSGSKVGSRYKSMMASTNEAFAPTLRARAATDLIEGEGAVLEIVIDGLTAESVATAMREGLRALRESDEGTLLNRITAGNYGGKLGPHHYHLKELAA